MSYNYENKFDFTDLVRPWKPPGGHEPYLKASAINYTCQILMSMLITWGC